MTAYLGLLKIRYIVIITMLGAMLDAMLLAETYPESYPELLTLDKNE